MFLTLFSTSLLNRTGLTFLRAWTLTHPGWLEVVTVKRIDDAAMATLGAGERAAITLAVSLHAQLILIDERKGTKAALDKGFDVTGTLGILRLAAQRGLIHLADCFNHLKQTNFRYRQNILDAMLAEHSRSH